MRDVKLSLEEQKMWQAVLAAASGRALPEWPADEKTPTRERNASTPVPFPDLSADGIGRSVPR